MLLLIRRMRTDSYEVRNTTHWLHFANEPDAAPLFDEDTRITALLVSALEKEIPEHELKELLKEEAPRFLYTLMTMSLPEPNGRLRIPIIETDFKTKIAATNRTYLQAFIDIHCDIDLEEKVVYGQFYDELVKWLPRDESYTKRRLSRELAQWPELNAKNGTNNVMFIHGLKWKAEVTV